MLTQRIFYHVVGRPFLRGLVLPCFMVIFFIAAADASIDWEALRQQVMLLPPWMITALFAGLFLGWSVAAGLVLRPIWRQPMIAFLVRQPLTRWQWVAGLLPSLGVAFVPVLTIWWLAPQYANSVIHYLGFVGLAWPIILGVSFSGSSSIIVAGGGLTSLAVLVFAYSAFPFAAYAALLVTLVQLPLSVAFIPRQISRVHNQKSGQLSGTGVVVALIRRDLRCLLRLEWKSFTGLAFFGTVSPLMMLAIRSNETMDGREAFFAGCILFSFVALTIYESLEKLKTHLGKEFIRLRWPVTFTQRGTALIGLVALLVVPSGVLIGLFGSMMGATNLVYYFLFIAVTITVCAALLSRLLDVQVTANGFFWTIIVAHGVLVFSLSGWRYAIFAIPAIFINFLLITSGLRRFAINGERSVLDQPA